MQDFMNLFEQGTTPYASAGDGQPATDVTDNVNIFAESRNTMKSIYGTMVGLGVQRWLYLLGGLAGATLGYGNVKYDAYTKKNASIALLGTATGTIIGLGPGFVYGLYQQSDFKDKVKLEKYSVALVIPMLYFTVLTWVKKAGWLSGVPLVDKALNRVDNLAPDQFEHPIKTLNDVVGGIMPPGGLSPRGIPHAGEKDAEVDFSNPLAFIIGTKEMEFLLGTGIVASIIAYLAYTGTETSPA